MKVFKILHRFPRTHHRSSKMISDEFEFDDIIEDDEIELLLHKTSSSSSSDTSKSKQSSNDIVPIIPIVCDDFVPILCDDLDDLCDPFFETIINDNDEVMFLGSKQSNGKFR